MKAIMLTGSPTLFSVQGELLRCTRVLHCDFHSKAKCYHEGQECPKCEKGLLEPAHHQVDLRAFDANGECDCETFQKTMAPLIRKMRTAERMKVRVRCKHIKAARAEAETEAGVTALLLTLPEQSQEEVP